MVFKGSMSVAKVPEFTVTASFDVHVLYCSKSHDRLGLVKFTVVRVACGCLVDIQLFCSGLQDKKTDIISLEASFLCGHLISGLNFRIPHGTYVGGAEGRNEWAFKLHVAHVDSLLFISRDL